MKRTPIAGDGGAITTGRILKTAVQAGSGGLQSWECPRIPDLSPDLVRLRPAAPISNFGGVPPRVKTQHANGESGTWRRFLPVPPPEPAGMERMKKMAHKGGRLDV